MGAARRHPLYRHSRHFTGTLWQWTAVLVWLLTAQKRWKEIDRARQKSERHVCNYFKARILKKTWRLSCTKIHSISVTVFTRRHSLPIKHKMVNLLMKHSCFRERDSHLDGAAPPRARQGSVLQSDRLEGPGFDFHQGHWVGANTTSGWAESYMMMQELVEVTCGPTSYSWVGSTPVPAELSQFSGKTLIPVQ